MLFYRNWKFTAIPDLKPHLTYCEHFNQMGYFFYKTKPHSGSILTSTGTFLSVRLLLTEIQ